jgi:hypothetical protein
MRVSSLAEATTLASAAPEAAGAADAAGAAAGAAEAAGAASAAGYLDVSFLKMEIGQIPEQHTQASPVEGVEVLTALALTAMLATAAVISAAVASSTSRFCEKMQPSTSSTTSQVLPLPVSSLS